MTSFSLRLAQVCQNPSVFNNLKRGIEREALRYSKQSRLAKTRHPEALGSAYANKWITTDFSESQLEIVTPVSRDINTLFAQLEDIHHFTQANLGSEYMWPMSMPYNVSESDIVLGQYGACNAGRLKTLYRKGLKSRYGSKMQIISGVHYNFSLPESFWDELFGKQCKEQRQEAKSDAYLGLIRNYYRFGWLIPYFFGASPAVCSSYVNEQETDKAFLKVEDTLYLPYSTSLRLSDIGYSNNTQEQLNISLSSLDDYLSGLQNATRTSSSAFEQIGVKVGGEYQQLNSNILQLENEFYAPIRPKRVPNKDEKVYEALSQRGVEYIEVRALDINPYSSVGISEEQVRFLDLFLIWAVLKDSDLMTERERENCLSNWKKVTHQGRKPGLKLQCGTYGKTKTLQEWATLIIGEITHLAEAMDKANGQTDYQSVCHRLTEVINHPELTIAGQLQADIEKAGGIKAFGYEMGTKHVNTHLSHRYRFYSAKDMENEVTRSWYEQEESEKSDRLDFDTFLVANF
ncbi:glutamate--cysteine ligase [Vibrio hannami]|uniref:glutamate--cysteine ligase n=1 Tax=Vibrio hannami TaxID=2717094 RepID=UPI00240F08D7|nr:glutamate--cysteine ligase [Vibrio hannami]MDG3088572.1 glutamate--cysteine ligase [Vibrio hannami]